LHPRGPQPDQGEFRGSEEGQQKQQGRRCQESHRVQMGVERIELTEEEVASLLQQGLVRKDQADPQI
jgi:hypothetical protein